MEESAMRARANISSHPIHPMLVAFPIGLWITGFALDLAGLGLEDARLWTAGWFAILAGCIGAVLAAIFGATDLLTVVPPNSSAKKRGYLHGFLNVLALGLFSAALAFLGGADVRPYALPLLLAAAGVVVVGISGWLGGTLVYRNQIGVDHRYAGAGKWRERTLKSWERPACGEHELSYGQMMLIHVGGERVVVARCSDGIVAFADHCTHRGGPLSDGMLAGCTVQCAWHGSQFDTHTGRVIAGPAKSQITVYDTEIRGTEVYVKPRVEPEKKAA
jgi:uncharacterized membrane protein/nitrite reductase/ring-hydroxylating ferredoxin subunit